MTKLKGIDISNWQKGIDPSNLNIEFCICKITEGINFLDAQFKTFYEKASKAKLKFGFYHFARENDPVKEADYFYSKCKSYLKKGIPVLDYEVWGKNSNDVAWCEKFIKRFYELSGIYCMIYISASRCAKFKCSWIPNKCALWVAGYPKAYTSWVTTNMPYNIQPWKTAAIWQFTSSLKLKNWSGNLDGDIAYIDVWKDLDSSASKPTESKPTETKPASTSPFKGKGKYRCVVDAVNIRNGAGIDQTIVGAYHKNDTVILDDWKQNRNGFTWSRYTGSTSGKKRYIALGTSDGKHIYFEND